MSYEWLFAAILLIIPGYLILSNLLLNIVDLIRPYTYRGITLDGLGGHVSELFRRGYGGARMYICPETDRCKVVVHKIFLIPRGIGIRLNVRPIKQNGPTCRRLIEMLRCRNVSYHEGMSGLMYDPNALVIDCGSDLDRIVDTVSRVVSLTYGERDDIKYKLWVRGLVDWRDVCVEDNVSPSFGEIMWAVRFMHNKQGRPYKRTQDLDRKSLPYKLGRGVGKVLRFIVKGR